MKVNPLTEAVRFLNQVQEKREDRSGGKQQQERRKEGSASEDAASEISDQKIGDAVREFAGDAQARAAGLSAATEGNGPGLRVVLKDINGSVIRQYTGEEFLRLRQGVSKNIPARGKLLDQKF